MLPLDKKQSIRDVRDDAAVEPEPRRNLEVALDRTTVDQTRLAPIAGRPRDFENHGLLDPQECRRVRRQHHGGAVIPGERLDEARGLPLERGVEVPFRLVEQQQDVREVVRLVGDPGGGVLVPKRGRLPCDAASR